MPRTQDSAGQPSRRDLIAIFAQDLAVRGRLRATLASQCQPIFFDTLLELRRFLIEPTLRGVLLELRDKSGECAAPVIRQCRDSRPTIPIVLYCYTTPWSGEDILAAIAAGTTALALHGFDDPSKILISLLETEGLQGAIKSVIARASDSVPAAVRPLFAQMVSAAPRGLSLTELSSQMGIPRRSLARRVARSGVYSPQVLAYWAKMLLAAELLQDRAIPVKDVAAQVGLSTPDTLRALFRRHALPSPARLRRRDGLDCAYYMFQRDMKTDLRPLIPDRHF